MPANTHRLPNFLHTPLAVSRKPLTLPSNSSLGDAATLQRAMQDPQSLGPNQVQVLQRQIGNRATTQLLAPKEATAPVQRSVSGPGLQVGPAHDRYEAEADRVASKVVGTSPQLQTSNETGQRKSDKDAHGVAFENGGKTSTDLESSIQRARGGNQGLDKGVQRKMEQGFGTDFSHVRVHADANADKLSRSLDAKAFTVGGDLFFRRGAYQPGSQGGQQLLAHELTHVVQQTGGVQRKLNKDAISVQNTGVAVQRLMTAKKFKKKTSLFARKGKSHAFFADITNALRAYQNLGPNVGDGEKVDRLEELLVKINTWLEGPDSANSSRRQYVVTLKGQVEGMIAQLGDNMQDLRTEDFTDDNLTYDQTGAVGGQMNKLDEVHYNFGVREVGGRNRKGEGGSFKGYFKSDVDVDENSGRHRGTQAGIPRLNPEFGNRNIAMYKLDRLLNAGVIPPTFRAMHNDKRGIVMSKVEGQTGSQLSNSMDQDDYEDMMNLPVVRRGLSNLYMLDFIAAQVDRHSGNYMIQMVDGKIAGVQGIDNDLAFGDQFDTQAAVATKRFIANAWTTLGQVPSQLQEIDRAFATRIIEVADDPNLVRDALAGVLSESEIEATVDRLGELANFLRPMMNQENGVIKTHWD